MLYCCLFTLESSPSLCRVYGHFAEHNCFNFSLFFIFYFSSSWEWFFHSKLELLVYFISFHSLACVFRLQFCFFRTCCCFPIHIINFLFALLSFQSHPICFSLRVLEQSFLHWALGSRLDRMETESCGTRRTQPVCLRLLKSPLLLCPIDWRFPNYEMRILLSLSTRMNKLLGWWWQRHRTYFTVEQQAFWKRKKENWNRNSIKKKSAKQHKGETRIDSFTLLSRRH